MSPYAREKMSVGVWWVEDMFSKHDDIFSKKSESFDLPDFHNPIPPIQEIENDENLSFH